MESLRKPTLLCLFYAVSALLARDNLSSAKHTGLRSLFNQHKIFGDVVTYVANHLTALQKAA
jgi:uncharacterized protein (UPF0332 family)